MENSRVLPSLSSTLKKMLIKLADLMEQLWEALIEGLESTLLQTSLKAVEDLII